MRWKFECISALIVQLVAIFAFSFLFFLFFHMVPFFLSFSFPPSCSSILTFTKTEWQFTRCACKRYLSSHVLLLLNVLPFRVRAVKVNWTVKLQNCQTQTERAQWPASCGVRSWYVVYTKTKDFYKLVDVDKMRMGWDGAHFRTCTTRIVI